MNPLINHRILQHLPFELLKNPDKEKIQKYLKKQIRTLFRLKILMIIFLIADIIFYLPFMNFHTPVNEMARFDKFADFFPLISFLLLAFLLHRGQKKYNISEIEIENEIKKFKSPQ